MHENIFEFYPVGQGLFYTGCIDSKYKFIYDCGSISNRNALKNSVEAYNTSFFTGENIKFAVISHFDEDHINGIELIEHKIENIFIPYFCSNYNASLIKAFFEYFSIDKISSSDINNDRINRFLNYFNKYWSSSKKKNDLDYISLLDEQKIWEFKLFNKTLSVKCWEKVIKTIKSFSSNDNYITDLINLRDFKTLKLIYKKAFCRKINDTSLVLIHYPIDFMHYSTYSSNFYNHNEIMPFTVLSGDICFDDEIIGRIRAAIPNLSKGIIQVPHHGSKNNWNSCKSYFNDFNIFVFSFGMDNEFGHPCPKAISETPLSKIIFVNELTSFSYKIILY